MRIRKLILTAGIATALSIVMAISAFAYTLYKTNSYMDASGNIISHYYGTDGQLIRNQWVLSYAPPKNPSAALAEAIAYVPELQKSQWLYIGDDGMALGEGATTPDGYTLGKGGIYYSDATEADKDAYEAFCEYLRTVSGTTTTNTTTTTQSASPDNYMTIGTEEFNEQLFNIINDYRASKGLNRLKHSDDADAVAEMRALEMPYTFLKSHARPDYRECGTAWEDVTGEILTAAKTTECALWSIVGGCTPQSAFEAWKNSPSHNEAMLKESRSIMGIGSCVSSGKGVVFVAMETR